MYCYTQTLDELFAIKNLNSILTQVKKIVEMKTRSMQFAGMESDDVVQEVLIKIVNSIDRYDSEKGMVSTFVEKIINNTIRDCLRKSGSIKNLMVINANQLVSDNDDFNDEDIYKVSVGQEDTNYSNVEFLIDILEYAGLTKKEKEIFKLRSSGYDFVEIAKFLGLSKARVSQLWKSIVNKYASNM